MWIFTLIALFFAYKFARVFCFTAGVFIGMIFASFFWALVGIHMGTSPSLFVFLVPWAAFSIIFTAILARS